MKTCVVGKHKRSQVEFPVERRIVAEAGEIFGNCFVCDFCLAVALQMMRGSHQVVGVKPLNSLSER